LAAEVSEILNAEEAGQISTVGRYALTARVLILGWIAGMTPHFNCRSGKDRTGLVDVEVKFLYYQLTCEMAGYSVSRLGEPRLAHEELAWRSFVLSGGNHEIQEYNTGYRGSKLDHSSLRERIGAEIWLEFIGDSHLADV
jgi:phosphatidylinositol-4,5-bisphosphate 4-phosphatase